MELSVYARRARGTEFHFITTETRPGYENLPIDMKATSVQVQAMHLAEGDVILLPFDNRITVAKKRLRNGLIFVLAVGEGMATRYWRPSYRLTVVNPRPYGSTGTI